MSLIETRAIDWIIGFVDGCDSLVRCRVEGGARVYLRRLVGLTLAAPFILTPAIVQAMIPAYGTASSLAVLFASFAAAWFLACNAALRGHSPLLEIASMLAATGFVVWLVAMHGGINTPMAALLIVPPLESWWVSRSSKATLTATLAASAGAIMIARIDLPAIAASATVSAWQWLTPALYTATLALRAFAHERERMRAVTALPLTLPAEAFHAVSMRVSAAGEVESVSSQARHLLRLEPDLLLGRGFFDRLHVADRVTFLRAVSQARDGDVSQHVSIRLRMPMQANGEAGPYRAFEAEIARIDDARTIIAIVRDGREIAALREEIAHARAQVEEADIAKSNFLAAVSHELRTPLNAIIGFSDMLLQRDISDNLTARQTGQVELIHDAGNHLLAVVNAVLDISKIEAGSYQLVVEPFDFSAAVEMCRAMLAPQAAEKHVVLNAGLPPGLGPICGDRRAFQQIMFNLLSNAIKFTPPGGNVCVTASRSSEQVRIRVSDTGIGIAADDLKKIGRPFMQIHNEYTRDHQGTGLGLSLVKGLVALHGGSMSIESELGHGTSVVIELPALRRASGEETIGAQAPLDAEQEIEDTDGRALRKIA